MDLELHRQRECTGEWWQDSFWSTEGHAEALGVSPEKLEVEFSELIALFTSLWTREELKKLPHRRHPIYSELFVRGRMPVAVLAVCGRGLLASRQIGRYTEYRSRILDPEDFKGAMFELEILSHLLETGVAVYRNGEKGEGNNTCDFKVDDGSCELFIEVKSIEESSWSKVLSEVTHAVHMVIQERLVNIPDLHLVSVELTPKLRALAEQKAGLVAIKEEWRHMANWIAEDIEAKALLKRWGTHLVGDLATYEIRAFSETNSRQGYMSGFSSPDHAGLQKIKVNALQPALYRQLPRNKPSIIIINPGRGRYTQLSQESFKEEFSEFPMLVGVIIWYSSFSGDSGRLEASKKFFSNPYRENSACEFKIISLLLSPNPELNPKGRIKTP
jgi:hypothetical protein